MQFELEKKYNLTQSDYAIITDNCDFIGEKHIKDYYLDTNFILVKNWYYLRLRDGKYELKIYDISKNSEINTAEEYENEEEIEGKLAEFWITTDDVVGIMFADTVREQYEYTFEWQKINIDIDRFQYWERYEIEIIYQDNEVQSREELEQEANTIIESFRTQLWLSAQSDESAYKTLVCAMHQNIDLYEIRIEQK